MVGTCPNCHKFTIINTRRINSKSNKSFYRVEYTCSNCGHKSTHWFVHQPWINKTYTEIEK